jgi:hypothetical protein
MARKRATPAVQIYDGQWYALGGYTHQHCCDCALVHTIEHKLVKGRIFERVTRDDKATATNRRMHGIEVVRKDPR